MKGHYTRGKEAEAVAGLTERQKRFIEEYLVDLNATAAASRAGYKDPSIGRKLYTKKHVSKIIHERMRERGKRLNLSQDYVLNNLEEIVKRCMQKTPVKNIKGGQVIDDDGEGLWTFDARNAIRALELLGKHLGMFREKVEMEHSGPDGGPVAVKHSYDLDALSEEELLTLEAILSRA